MDYVFQLVSLFMIALDCGTVAKGLSTYSLFPRLTSTGRLWGEGVRQWTLVRGIFGQKQTDAFS